ncbi:MAG: phosphatidylserine decarboxylase family protein [Bacteroidota bacterium]|nr:phosphatidylserine decarboxylase family protein [Bacteroidota bacterium]
MKTKMTIHKEGFTTISIVLLFVTAVIFCSFYFIEDLLIIKLLLLAGSLFFLGFITRFFRFPKRELTIDNGIIISPADGQVVVIEETRENEYFNDKRIQVSIFMSAHNVHINWVPIGGLVKYFKYHPGKFLIAHLPKSSTLNERTTFVIETENKKEILVRQIAGFVARRILTYPKQGENVLQGQQLGFIKFGSRVDIFLPLGTKINVKLNEKVKGTQTVIAEL